MVSSSHALNPAIISSAARYIYNRFIFFKFNDV